MAAEIEYLQYKFHIKDTYSTANDETLTGSCASTYSYVFVSYIFYLSNLFVK